CTDRGLASRARTLDLDFEVADPAFLRGTPGGLGSDLRRERRGLARALEAGTARRGPRQRVALAVGDRDDRVVERRVDVRNAVRHVLLGLLASPRRRSCLRCRLSSCCHVTRTPLVTMPVACRALPGGLL